MTSKQRIQNDLKRAMLSRDRETVQVLQGLKSAILYAEVESGQREAGLSEEEVQTVLAKEAKKRQESIDVYEQGGSSEQAAIEKREKDIIQSYLPKQLSQEELAALVDAVISESDSPLTMKELGKVIAEVKQRTGAGADGATIAKLVKERLSTEV